LLGNHSRTIASIVWKIIVEPLSSIVPHASLLSKAENGNEISTGQLLVTDSKRLTTFHEQLGEWFYYSTEEVGGEGKRGDVS